MPSGFRLALSPTVKIAFVMTPGTTGTTYGACELQTAGPRLAGGGGGDAPFAGSKSTPTVARPFWTIRSATCVTSTNLMIATTETLDQVGSEPAPTALHARPKGTAENVALPTGSLSSMTVDAR